MSAGFGIYIHWPYCSAICPYCDFNVHRARGEDPAPLLSAIERDIAANAVLYGKRAADTVFFGGGTPSLLSGADIARLLSFIAQAHGLNADAEVTLECNPEDAPRFAEQAAAGVNRFSIGVQALHDDALKRLGRFHSAADGVRAVEAAAKTGQRVSIDMIYAREGQTVEEWEAELREALSLPVEHVSLYQLTIEAGTAFDRAVQRGTLKPPDGERGAALFEATQEICEAAGFSAYEISNFARDAAAQSRHNLLYWRGGDWLGVGPGAHGRITQGGVRLATQSVRDPNAYVRGDDALKPEALTDDEIADEALILGLRVAEGLPLARLAKRLPDPKRIAALSDEGLLTVDADRLTLTKRGRLFADRIALELSR